MVLDHLFCAIRRGRRISSTFFYFKTMTMKHLVFLLSVCLLLANCQGDSSASKSKDLERIKAELEAKKKELSDKQQIAELEQELKTVEQQIREVGKSPGASANDPATAATAEQKEATTAAEAAPAPAPKSRIVGNSVIMRKASSVKSDKMGSFKNGEEVTVLETKNVNNENEAVLTKPIQLYVSESNSGDVAMTLPKGKAVVIEKYNADDNKYEVSYHAEGKGKLFANISADAVETISYSTWYRVKRATGEEGWVLGKFLKM